MEKTTYRNEYRTFKTNLRKARMDAGLTQKQVAKELKKPQSYVSKVESGERRVDVVELKDFSRIYKKPITAFINTKK